MPSLQRVVGGLLGALPGMGSILLLIALVFYVSAVMAVNLYGKEFPHLFGTLGTSLYTLFTIMTLEGWTNDVVNPIREKHPYALFFFIPFIVITTFWVLNLFIGIIVNAMQEEHSKSEAETREAERQAERKAERAAIHDETAPLMRELQALKAEVVALRAEIAGTRKPSRRKAQPQ